MKKYKILTVTSLLLIAIIATVFLTKSDRASAENIQNSIDKVKQITNKEFGEPKVKQNSDTSVILEDDKYTYQFDNNKKEIISMMLKDYDKEKKTETKKTKEEAQKDAEKFLNKFNDFNIKDMILTNYQETNNDYENTYNFIFEGITPNGIKTGGHANITVNSNGELLSIIMTKGNIAISENTQPKISKDKAYEIAIDHLKNKYPEFNELTQYLDSAKKTYEVKIFNDKPVINVSFDHIKIQKNISGYTVMIDAMTGEILFDDSYSTFE